MEQMLSDIDCKYTTETFVQWSRAGQMFYNISIFCESLITLTIFRMGLFRGRSRIGGQKGPRSPKPVTHIIQSYNEVAYKYRTLLKQDSNAEKERLQILARSLNKSIL